MLGQPFVREIDRGLAMSRTGLVLVTPALLKRVHRRGVSDKELSELLARDLGAEVVQHDRDAHVGRVQRPQVTAERQELGGPAAADAGSPPERLQGGSLQDAPEFLKV